MHPFIHLSDDLKIPVYLLFISFSYCVGLYWLLPRAQKLNLSKKHALDISLIIMVSGFLGARLLHIFYEEPVYYLNHPMETFKFWNGGFVFYGGLIGTLLGGFLYLRKNKLSFYSWSDLFAPIGALGYAIGRLGCFFNGCCYGGVCELPWSVQFPHLLPLGVGRHPTQLYIVIWEVAVLGLLLFLEKRNSLKRGQLFFSWIFCHSLGRIVMEFLRDDPRGAPLFGLSVSTWISFVLIVVSVERWLRIQKSTDNT